LQNYQDDTFLFAFHPGNRHISAQGQCNTVKTLINADLAYIQAAGAKP
jgi:hypothetical protein